MILNNIVNFVTGRDLNRRDTLYHTKAQQRLMTVTMLIIVVAFILWLTFGPAIIANVRFGQGGLNAL